MKVVGLYSDLSLRLTARDEDGLQSIGAEWDACRRLCNHENIVTFYNVIWWRPEVGQLCVICPDRGDRAGSGGLGEYSPCG